MKCGHCKTESPAITVEHVRSCSGLTTSSVLAYAEPRGPVTEAGMYRLDGVIYKVQKAVHGSGHLYAKELRVIRNRALWDNEGESIVEFVYAPGAVARLHAEDRLTLEEAKHYGALYGTCIVCGRTLTAEQSIEAGIGPVCAGRI